MHKCANLRVLTILLYLSVFLFSSITTEGQASGNVLKGKIIDSITNFPIPYVTVGLYKMGNTAQAIKNTYTDQKGEFTLTGIDSGNYQVIVSNVGYKEKEITISFKIRSGENKELGTLLIVPVAKSLNEVVVAARRPLIEQGDDKVGYNVENDPMAVGETALDLLKKVPLVTVDGQNNITVNGQTSFRVLLNGRETSMFARNVADVLRGFPGNIIKKIEVITSPSAKYDGEGIGGLINIITKRKVAGYNASISTVASNTNFMNTSINLNVKYGKFGISGYVGHGGNFNMPNRNEEEIIALNPVAFYKRLSKGESRVTNTWTFGNLEASLEIDSLHTVAAYFIPGGNTYKNDLTTNFSMIMPNMTDTVRSIFSSFYDNKTPTNNAGLDLIKKFKNKPEKEISVRLNHDFGSDNSFGRSFQDNPGIDRYIVNNSRANNKQYTIQTDLILPLAKKKKLEIGGKAILRTATSDYVSQIKFNDSDPYKLNPSNTDKFNYQQDVYSLYSTFSFPVKKFNFRIGLRMETTDVNGDFVSAAIKVRQHYTNLLPNILVSTKLKKGQTLVFTYSMRLARPYIWNLNPFTENTDSLIIVRGNPDLQPQTFHSIGTQFRFQKGSSFYNFSLTNTYSNNRVIQYFSFNDVTGVTTSSPANIGRSYQSSLNLSLNTKFSSKWSYNANGSISYTHIENNTGLGSKQSNAGFGGNLFMNSSYELSPRFSLSAYIGANRPLPSLQGIFGTNLYYGTGVNHKFFNSKLVLNLSVVNFHTDYFPYTIRFRDENFKRKTTNAFIYRGIQASINWNFGKLSENVSKKKGVTNDDLLSK